MDESFEVLRKAIEKEGVKSMASSLGVSQPLVYKWCQNSAETKYRMPSGASNPLDRIRKIYEHTKDDALINWICQVADGYFVKNAIVDKASCDEQMMRSIRKLIKEFSDTLDSISQCYYDDNRVDENEASLIRKEWEDLKRIGEGFVRACELGKFDKPSLD